MSAPKNFLHEMGVLKPYKAKHRGVDLTTDLPNGIGDSLRLTEQVKLANQGGKPLPGKGKRIKKNMPASAFGVEHEFSKKAPSGLAGLLKPYKGAVPKGPSNEALVNRPKTMALRSARRNAGFSTKAKPGRAMGS
jgi:hypothetical protein